MRIDKTGIEGCYEIIPATYKDERGRFVKTLFPSFFKANQLEYNFTEQYYSISTKGVLRGLHFQLPPKEHTKLVYCVSGIVMDVVVDVRKNSPTYGKYSIFMLESDKGNMVYIPPGLAHGFYVISEQAIIICHMTTVFSPKHDSGIRWNSLSIPWPDDNPILSKKDRDLPALSDFVSPFTFQP
ncbi:MULTISPECIES: dTDP-4-dehydrorhamnose 3,5-epimerase [Bacillaceae]|uniref:dTDP-4-dehydrorhamnose 3,5-epimerase n=1 Tax=Bacillaceae TaxID=186817 RepID=UPI002FFD5E22